MEFIKKIKNSNDDKGNYFLFKDRNNNSNDSTEILDLEEKSLYFYDISTDELNNIGDNPFLEELDIVYCNIEDVSKLSNCTNLNKLALYNCLISDISPLYNLTELKSLDLTNNSVKELDLTKFPNLERIRIKGNYALYTDELFDYCEKNNIYLDITREDVNNVNTIRKIVNDMNLNGLSTLEKEEKIYTYILEKMEYDKKALRKRKLAIEYNKYPLKYALEGNGVCVNYAALFDAMCEVAGINIYEVSGYAKSNLFLGGPHAWNLVEIDGQYMLCDPTWSDSIRNSCDYKIFSFVRNIFGKETDDKFFNIYGDNAEKFIKKHNEENFDGDDITFSKSDKSLEEVETGISIQTNENNELEIGKKIITGMKDGLVSLFNNKRK